MLDSFIVWSASKTKQYMTERKMETGYDTAILRAFMDDATDAICIRDRERRLILWNEAFARGVRLNCGVEIRAGMRVEDYVPKEVLAGYGRQRELLYRALEGEPASATFAYPSLDGTTRHFDVRWSPVRDGEDVVAVAEVSRDVTEQTDAQERLRDNRDVLARLDRVAALSELTATLGHELNQPLGAIRANAEAGARFLAARNPDLDELREILRDIIRDDQRATDMIKRVHALVSGRLFQPEALDIQSLIQRVLSLVDADAARRGLIFDFDTDQDLPCVMGDRVQLEQVLLNLILNGFDAVQDSPTRRLSVATTVMGVEFLQVSVRDTGSGASGQSLEKLFDSFFTTKPEGMGMGLAISRTIVEAHGGRIWATENHDRGLTFHFTVPVASQRPSRESNPRL